MAPTSSFQLSKWPPALARFMIVGDKMSVWGVNCVWDFRKTVKSNDVRFIFNETIQKSEIKGHGRNEEMQPRAQLIWGISQKSFVTDPINYSHSAIVLYFIHLSFYE